MATQRFISTSFWDDEWIITLKPDEKLVYLYLMTNTLTNIAGVYKISIKRIVYDTDLTKSIIEKTLLRFEEAKKAYYFGEYIVIPSWPKHQRVDHHPKLKAGIYAVLDSLSYDLICFLRKVCYCFDLSRYDSLSETTDSERLSSNYLDPDLDLDTDKSILSGKPDGASFHWEVLDYLNQRTGRQYKRVQAHSNRIKSRIKEGYSLEDFKKVIDFKASEWTGKDDFEKYLRPETLFGTKFDSYLAESGKAVAQEARGSAPSSNQDKVDELLRMRREALGQS